MRSVPFCAYVTARENQQSCATSKIVQVHDRPGVYNSVDEALRHEHAVIALCQKYNRTIELVMSTSVQTIVRINKHGRVSGRKKADTVAGTKSGS